MTQTDPTAPAIPSPAADAARALFLQGVEALLRHDYAGAEEKLAAAHRLLPERLSILINLSAALLKQGKTAAARDLAQQALTLDATAAEAALNLAGCLEQDNAAAEALTAYDRLLARQPDYAEAWCGRASALGKLFRYREALEALQRAVTLKPAFPEAWCNKASIHDRLRQYDAAHAALAQAATAGAALPYLQGLQLHYRLGAGDWRDIAAAIAAIERGVAAGQAVCAPFDMLRISAAPDLQQACAAIHRAGHSPQTALPASPPPRGDGRIRLGYFSADFHNHATAYLIAELIERHDRDRFDVTAFSFGPRKQDEMRQRLLRAFDRFIEIGELGDAAAAALARQQGIDIAIDLKGYTEDARPGIFAARAAPLQVSYLGYPGTMAAPFIDYILADAVLVPPADRRFYDEKVVCLPHSYQVNDATRRIAPETPTREAAGLPPQGFVFCCFNNSFKLLPEVFDGWLRLLRQIDGSVLWLMDGHPAFTANLRRRAQQAGIAPDRLVFAGRLPLAEHLARHRLADLFLDTRPCNAHTTASDALWAGLPVLTCHGQTFAGRVAASLLTAIGLPQLIAADPAAYEAMALQLARDPDALRQIRATLQRNRLSAPLFNTPLFRDHIEAAFIEMQRRQSAGLAPDHFDVAPDKNAAP